MFGWRSKKLLELQHTQPYWIRILCISLPLIIVSLLLISRWFENGFLFLFFFYSFSPHPEKFKPSLLKAYTVSNLRLSHLYFTDWFDVACVTCLSLFSHCSPTLTYHATYGHFIQLSPTCRCDDSGLVVSELFSLSHGSSAYHDTFR